MSSRSVPRVRTRQHPQGLFQVGWETEGEGGGERLGGEQATGGGDRGGAGARMRPMATLRKAAIACGAVPARTWERSSSKVTSRT